MPAHRKPRVPTWEALIESAKLGCGFIPLPNRRYTLVDEDKMEELEALPWRAEPRGYVKASIGEGGKNVFLHRFLTCCPPDLEVDHRNRKKHDNRSENLRVCTTRQNAGNATLSKRKDKTSQYKGVSKRLRDLEGDKHWHARGVKSYRSILIGRFKTEIEAALAYNKWAIETFGEFACINEIKQPC